MDKHMSHDLFNIGVHILATTEHQYLKSSHQWVTKHYMDLRFCVSKTFFLFAVIKVYDISQELFLFVRQYLILVVIKSSIKQLKLRNYPKY
jgi:hypothetical protein